MGYRFVLQELQYPETMQAGEKVTLTLKVENKGVAPIYNALPLTLRFKGENQTASIQTDIDVRKWLPGEHTETIEIVVPTQLQAGNYQLQMRIGGEDLPCVQLATETQMDCEYAVLASISL